jgi:hypothetical protein
MRRMLAERQSTVVRRRQRFVRLYKLYDDVIIIQSTSTDHLGVDCTQLVQWERR